VRLWVLPTSVFSDLADYALDEEWADVFEPKKGYAFSIKRQGSGLDTEYTTKPQRKAFPVGKAVLDQVIDPLSEIKLPSLESQCAEIGMTVDDLFEPDEIEELSDERERPSKKATKKTNGGKKKGKAKTKDVWYKVGDAIRYLGEEEICHITAISKDGSSITIESYDGTEYEVEPEDMQDWTAVEPEDDTFAIGDPVRYLDEDGICHITAIDGDDVTIEDAEGDEYDVKIDELTMADDVMTADGAEVLPEDGPKCFGDPELYDENDEECMKCDYFEQCGGNVDLTKAGVGDNRKPVKNKKSRSRSSDADDVVSGIMGGKRRK